MTYKTDTHTILYSDKTTPDAECFTRLLAAMEQFNLDVATPLEPNLHRRQGVFECNQVHIGRANILPLCIAMKNEIYQKFDTLDLPQLAKQALQLDIKHGLVCNALIYANA